MPQEFDAPLKRQRLDDSDCINARIYFFDQLMLPIFQSNFCYEHKIMLVENFLSKFRPEIHDHLGVVAKIQIAIN